MVDSIHATSADDQPEKLVVHAVAAATIEAAYEESIASTLPHVLLVRPTTGAGKTYKAHEALRRHRTLGAALIVATHALADEHEAGLAMPGDVHVARGMTGLKVGGVPACEQHAAASRLVRLGVAPGPELCPSCPAFSKSCPASPLLAAKTGGARIEIVQSTRAAEQIAAFRREAKESGFFRVLFIDEPPPLIQVVQLPAAETVRKYMAACRRSVRELLEPIVDAVLAEARNPDCCSILDCLSRHLPKPRIAATIRAAMTADLVLGAEHQHGLASQLRTKRTGDADAFHSAREAIETIREAGAYPERTILHRDRDSGAVYLVSRARWVRELRGWVRDGGKAIVMDATADVFEYRSLGIGSKPKEGTFNVPLHVVDVHVRDADGSRRIFHKWGSAPRRYHVTSGGHVIWQELQGVLRHLAQTIRQAEPGPVGIIADLPTAKALQEQADRLRSDPTASSDVPVEFATLIREGIELRIGWYGAVRGLDKWKGVTVLACLGDAYPPVWFTQAIAAFLGGKSDPHSVSYRFSQAEVQQAVGRSRSIHSPVAIVHYGSKAPDARLAPQWKGAERAEPKVGRPRAKIQGVEHTGAELDRMRAESGLSKRAHAKSMGMKVATYMDRTQSVSTSSSTVAPAPWGRPLAELIDLASMLRWTTEE